MKKNLRQLCPLCKRNILTKNLSKHHVVPKSRDGNETKEICQSCHQQVHALFGLKEMAKRLGSLEDLRRDPEMQKYLHWIKKKDPDQVFIARKTRHRGQ